LFLLEKFILFEIFLRRKLHPFFLKNDQVSLQGQPLVVISNNCYSGQVYQTYKLPYASPFAGMFLYGPCYLKLLKNLQYYLNQPLQFIESSRYPDRPKTYPVALLDDIELHFSHYKTEKEAAEKWYRRTKRLMEISDPNRYFFILSDRERVDADLIREFHQLHYAHKLSFGARAIEGLTPQQHIHVFKQYYRDRKRVLNGKKMLKVSFLYFEVNQWFSTGILKRTRFKG
jgi:uncharacterized protein (DUF1919 family)